LFLISYLSHLSFLSYLLFSGLVVVFFVDLEHQIIPDEIVIPLIVLFSLYRLFPLLTSPPRPLISEMGEAGRFLPFIAAAGSFVLFYSVYALTKNKGMGFGDVKLAFLMGLVLGWPKTAVAFYLAFLTGAIFGVILILLGKAKLRQKIAFGPFLSFSTIAVFLWGEKIIKLVFRW